MSLFMFIKSLRIGLDNIVKYLITLIKKKVIMKVETREVNRRV